MTIKAKIKSIIRRSIWAAEYKNKYNLTEKQAYQLATLKEQHTVAAKRFVNQYNVPVEMGLLISADRKTVMAISFVNDKKN